jgi:hypothetical protein
MAHWGYGLFLTGQGRGEEAVSHAERALEVDPHTLATVGYVIQVLGLAHQFERGISLAKESLKVFANSRRLHMRLGRLYIGKSMIKEAWTEFQKVVELGGPPDHPFLASAYALPISQCQRKRAAVSPFLNMEGNRDQFSGCRERN